VNLNLASICAGVHALSAVICIACCAQFLAKKVDSSVLLGKSEGCPVLLSGMQSTRLSRHTLKQHANGHARRETMRVEENVRYKPRFVKRHILGRPQSRHYALLTMSRREFISRNRIAIEPAKNSMKHIISCFGFEEASGAYRSLIKAFSQEALAESPASRCTSSTTAASDDL